MQNGLIHYYYGNGKGKTTAAFGLAARALGAGMQVVVVQFLKSGASGEVAFFEGRTDMTLFGGKAGTRFAFQMSEEEKAETRRIHEENLQKAWDLAESGACDLLILDEVSDAVRLGLLAGARLFALLRQKPAGLEVAMTGHEPLPEFLEIADYVTQMRKEKHPYDRGVSGRRGIEF